MSGQFPRLLRLSWTCTWSLPGLDVALLTLLFARKMARLAIAPRSFPAGLTSLRAAGPRLASLATVSVQAGSLLRG